MTVCTAADADAAAARRNHWRHTFGRRKPAGPWPRTDNRSTGYLHLTFDTFGNVIEKVDKSYPHKHIIRSKKVGGRLRELHATKSWRFYRNVAA